jgi:hypothetical protein
MNLRLRCVVVLSAVAAGSALGQSEPAPKPAEPARPPPIVREARDVEGWKVHVDKRLLEEANADTREKALRVLGFKLYEITLLVPTDRLEKLRKIAIALDLECGKLTSMQYHPSAQWLKDNGHDPALVRMVHLPRARDLTGRMPINQQPMVILHELAHGFHDQMLDKGFQEPRIKEAWARVRDGGKFEKVAHISGDPRRHYALTNPMEFFAEMTEAYFGTNDFYPFVRSQLRTDFPDVHKLLEEIWGKRN